MKISQASSEMTIFRRYLKAFDSFNMKSIEQDLA